MYNKIEESNQYLKCDAEDKLPNGIKEWIDFFQKNKPQINSLSAGIMLLVLSGQNLGWGIFNNHIKVQPWAGGYEDDGVVFWTICSWFMANIFGFVLGSFTVFKFSKIQIYIFASLLSATSSSIFIAYSTNVYMISFGRVLGGISHGIVYIIVLIHASEVSIPKLRGYNISVINLCMIVGVLMTSCNISEIYKTRSYEIDPTRMLGISGIVCITIGIMLGLFLNRESPVYLLRKYQEREALNLLVRLRSELHETISIKREFDELTLMVKEDSRCNMNITNYCYPFVIEIILKTIFVSTFNMPLNTYFLELAKIHFYDGEVDRTGIYLLSARLTSILIFMFLIDFNRIKLFILSCFGSGIILLFLSFDKVTDDSLYSVIIPISFQLFAGIAISNISDIYAVDSVNTRFKPIFICITSIYETVLQIILTVSYFYFKITIHNLLTIFGIIMLFGLFAYPFCFKYTLLPDTSGLNLRQARKKFSS